MAASKQVKTDWSTIGFRVPDTAEAKQAVQIIQKYMHENGMELKDVVIAALLAFDGYEIPVSDGIHQLTREVRDLKRALAEGKVTYSGPDAEPMYKGSRLSDHLDDTFSHFADGGMSLDMLEEDEDWS